MVKFDVVTATLRKAPAPPLGVIASIVSGFEMVNARLELILLPLALDLLLWLGPHLSLQPVVAEAVDLIRAPAGVDPATARSFELLRERFQDFGATFNVFSVLSTAPLGLPSLLAGRATVTVPGGAPVTWLIHSSLEGLLLMGALALIGLFLGALFFGSIAQQVRDARVDGWRLLRQVWRDWARLTALAAVGLALVTIIGVPVLLLSGVVSLFSPAAGGFVSVLGSTVVLWILFYSGFTLHGMILHRRGLFGALWDSLRLVHRSLPHTAGLYLSIIIISIGLGLVWNIPRGDSWLLLIGLVGNALVSTALVAATFAFYKDRYRWWIEMGQALRAQTEAAQSQAKPTPKS